MSKIYISQAIKAQVYKRAGKQCEYCRALAKYSVQPFVVEHIIPKAKGGATELQNLALSCGGCNGHKYTKVEAIDPVNNELVTLFNPRQHQWSEHFIWDEDLTKIIGLTPIGRATIEALKLNREELQQIRRLTILTKEHPPK